MLEYSDKVSSVLSSSKDPTGCLSSQGGLASLLIILVVLLWTLSNLCLELYRAGPNTGVAWPLMVLGLCCPRCWTLSLVLLTKLHTVLASPLFQPFQVSLQDCCHFSHIHLTSQFSVISKLGEGAFNLALFVLSCFTTQTCLTTKRRPQSWQEGGSSDIWAGISDCY